MASKERPSYEALSCRSNLHAAINLIEQDHRGVKLRIGPMLGFRLVSSRPIRIARLSPAARSPERWVSI
jgi:transposase-like protein